MDQNVAHPSPIGAIL